MADDISLLREYAGTRDAEAFAELVRRYAGLVYGVCLRVTGSPHDAEDVAQECFLELAEKAGTVTTSVPGWLQVLAASRSTSAIRRAAARRRHEERAMREKRDEGGSVWSEVSPRVDRALAELPEDLRVPLTLHYLVGRTQSDVADELGVNHTTVSRRLTRGVDALRERLEKAGVIVPAAVLAALLAENASAAAVPAALTAALGKMALAGVGNVGSSAAAGAAGKAAAVGVGAMKVKVIAASVAAAVVAIGGIVAYRELAGEEPTVEPAALQGAAVAWGEAKDGLRTRIWTDKPRYEAGEEMWLHVEFQNTSGEDRVIRVSRTPEKTPQQKPTPLYDVRLFLNRERSLTIELLPVPSNAVRANADLRELSAGHTYRERCRLDSGVWSCNGLAPGFAFGPARYRLWAGYPLLKAYMFTEQHKQGLAQLGAPLWDGGLRSNTVSFEVVERKPVAWGEAKGLQCRLSADRDVWREGDVVTFKSDVRNTGEQAFFVPMQQEGCHLQVNGKWYQWGGPSSVRRPLFPPGKGFNDIPLFIGGDRGRWLALEAGGSEYLSLTPGKHVVRVALIVKAERERLKHLRAASNPVEIEITAKGEAGAPAGEVAWGEAVDGLRAGLDVKGRRFGEGQPIEAEVRVRNVGGKALSLLDVGRVTSWRFVLAPVGGGKRYRAFWRVNRRLRQFAWPLAGGQEMLAVRPLIGGGDRAPNAAWEFVDADLPKISALRTRGIKRLPPGRYKVTASYGVTEHIARYPHLQGRWPGNVTTGEVEIEIVPEGAAAEARPGEAPAASRPKPVLQVTLEARDAKGKLEGERLRLTTDSARGLTFAFALKNLTDREVDQGLSKSAFLVDGEHHPDWLGFRFGKGLLGLLGGRRQKLSPGGEASFTFDAGGFGQGRHRIQLVLDRAESNVVEMDVAAGETQPLLSRLSVAARPTKTAFAREGPLAFEVTFKNVSKDSFRLFDVDRYRGRWWQYVIENVNSGDRWRALPPDVSQEARERIATPLGPGEAHTVKAVLEGFRFVAAGLAARRPWPPKFDAGETTPELLPGRYRATVTVRVFARRSERDPNWGGKFATKPVEIEIAP